MSITSLIVGFGAGLVLVASGNYIAQCANDSNISYYYSYFYAAFSSTQVIGCSVGSIVLREAGFKVFYMSLAGASLIGTMLFAFLKQPEA